MATLEEDFKNIEKISGKGCLMEGVEVKDVERIPLSMVAVNRMLYGGIPKGRMIELSGPESSGKTTTTLMIIADYQKQDTRPVFFVDSEGTYDPRWAAKLGVDNSKGKFIKWAPENVTAEEVFQKVLEVAETNEVGFIVLDSIPALVPQQEDAKNMTEYQMGGISKPLTVFSRKLQKVLLTNDTVTFIGINQVRDNMSQYGPSTTTTGGRAWKHMCSIRLETSAVNVDANGVYVPESSDKTAGVKINVAVKKNKTAPKSRRLSCYVLEFEKGFDQVLDLVDTAIAMGIVSQAGASYSYSNIETGEVYAKGQGKTKFMKALDDETIARLRKEVLEYGN